MYEVNVMVYGVGEDLGYKRYCSNEELEQLLRTCDSSEIEYKELDIQNQWKLAFVLIKLKMEYRHIIKKFIPAKIAIINTL
jgi:hypothetical protein